MKVVPDEIDSQVPVAVSALALAGHAAAQVTFYENDGFRGDGHRARRTVTVSRHGEPRA